MRFLITIASLIVVVQAAGAQQLRPSIARIGPMVLPSARSELSTSQRAVSVQMPASAHWSRRTHVVIGALIGLVAAPLLYAATHDTTIICHRDMADCDYGPLDRLGGAILIGGAVGAGIGWFLPAGDMQMPERSAHSPSAPAHAL
jgi:hypothetical protein